MKLKLEDTISSPQDLAELILEIRKYGVWYSQSSIKARVSKKKSVDPPAISPTALRLIESSAEKGSVNHKSLESLLAALEKMTSDSPRITITLAAIAPGSLKASLVGWCREHIAPNVLVDFRFNSTLLGGMVVQYGSHIYDWSFRRQILAGREKFPEVLRSV